MQKISIHPLHPKADCKYTVMLDSGMANGVDSTGVYFHTRAEAEACAARLTKAYGSRSWVEEFENVHPLYLR